MNNSGYIGNKNSFKHGDSFSRLYCVWGSMRKRCLNPKNKAYKDYGGRGITICPEWTDKENGFINFRNWSLDNGYQEGLEIDREDNDGNYEPSNCRWVTSKINTQNRRNTKLSLEIANEIRELDKTGEYSRNQLSEKFNISKHHISNIINNKRWIN